MKYKAIVTVSLNDKIYKPGEVFELTAKQKDTLTKKGVTLEEVAEKK